MLSPLLHLWRLNCKSFEASNTLHLGWQDGCTSQRCNTPAGTWRSPFAPALFCGLGCLSCEIMKASIWCVSSCETVCVCVNECRISFGLQLRLFCPLVSFSLVSVLPILLGSLVSLSFTVVLQVVVFTVSGWGLGCRQLNHCYQY